MHLVRILIFDILWSLLISGTIGQVFWAGVMAPARYARFISYAVGAVTFFGWTLGVAGTVVFTGNLIVAFGRLVSSSYPGAEYQVYLIALANVILALTLNIIGIKILPGINKFMVVFLNASAFYMFVVFLAKAQPKVSAYDAFIKVVNETGWSSNGLVFLLGFLPGLLTVCLPDAAAHMAEEIPRPERTIPLVMFATSLLNAVAGFIMVIALIFCTIAPENLLEPVGGMPIFQIAKDAWDNQGWVITVALIMIIVPLNGAISIMTGGSRLLWAFSKHGGIVGGKFIGHTNAKLQVPINAVTATAVLAALLSLLVFGPSTVLNGIFGSSGICLSVSYFPPIYFMLTRHGKSLPEKRYFNLGRWGRVVNAGALCWISLATVMLSFPVYRPLTTTNMNWAAPVFAGLCLLAMINWVFVRHTYDVPKPLFIESLHG